jgi:NAD(P)-dependent dehydrogenase (short-subunit alcohol dehydrogenase family)
MIDPAIERPRGVLVTGAASGIGRATALRFGSLGHPVACLDICEAGARQVADDIREAGGEAEAITCDVADSVAVSMALPPATGALGNLGVVISNAGIVLRKSLMDTTVEEWDQTMATNLRGAFLIAKAVVPALSRRGGVLLFVTSVAAHIGFGLPAYTASKGALVALVGELAGELAHLGIRVNAVSPTTVQGTRVTAESLKDPAVLARTIGAIPVGRVAVPEDVVNALVFLARPESSMINGHVLRVDGGMSTSNYSLQRPAQPT